MLFWIGVRFIDQNTMGFDFQDFCDGDVDSLQEQVSAYLEFIQQQPGTDWEIDGYFQAAGPDDLDSFQPERWYFTLSKPNIVQLLKFIPSVANHTEFFDLTGDENTIFWSNSPRDDWSNGE